MALRRWASSGLYHSCKGGSEKGDPFDKYRVLHMQCKNCLTSWHTPLLTGLAGCWKGKQQSTDEEYLWMLMDITLVFAKKKKPKQGTKIRLFIIIIIIIISALNNRLVIKPIWNYSGEVKERWHAYCRIVSPQHQLLPTVRDVFNKTI